MKQLEIKKYGSVYIQPDNIMVENQMEGHHIVAKHHPETAINSTILCNPGIYPIPDLKWEEVKRPIGFSQWDFEQVAILTPSEPSKPETLYTEYDVHMMLSHIIAHPQITAQEMKERIEQTIQWYKSSNP